MKKNIKIGDYVQVKDDKGDYGPVKKYNNRVGTIETLFNKTKWAIIKLVNPPETIYLPTKYLKVITEEEFQLEVIAPTKNND